MITNEPQSLTPELEMLTLESWRFHVDIALHPGNIKAKHGATVD
jgi:hypothetical protein